MKKSQDELDELVSWLHKNGLGTDDKARVWLDKYTPNWREKNGMKLTHEEQIVIDKYGESINKLSK